MKMLFLYGKVISFLDVFLEMNDDGDCDVFLLEDGIAILSFVPPRENNVRRESYCTLLRTPKTIFLVLRSELVFLKR